MNLPTVDISRDLGECMHCPLYCKSVIIFTLPVVFEWTCTAAVTLKLSIHRHLGQPSNVYSIFKAETCMSYCSLMLCLSVHFS